MMHFSILTASVFSFRRRNLNGHLKPHQDSKCGLWTRTGSGHPRTSNNMLLESFPPLKTSRSVGIFISKVVMVVVEECSTHTGSQLRNNFIILYHHRQNVSAFIHIGHLLSMYMICFNSNREVLHPTSMVHRHWSYYITRPFSASTTHLLCRRSESSLLTSPRSSVMHQ